jgi:hypothetical protein
MNAYKNAYNRLVTMTEISGPKEPQSYISGLNKKVVLRDRLSKRAKIKLDLENIIKHLKDPSSYLKNIRFGWEDSDDEETRADLLHYANALNTAMNDRKKSLDYLFWIIRNLQRLDETFSGSHELYIYLQKLIDITKQRIDGLYSLRKKKLEESRDRSHDSSNSPEKVKIRGEKELELELMNLCEHYSSRRLSKDDLRNSLKNLVGNINSYRGRSDEKHKTEKNKSPLIKLAPPLYVQRSMTPNQKTWREINDKFKDESVWRKSPSLSNKSFTKISLEDLKNCQMKKGKDGKIYLVKNKKKRLGLKNSLSSKKPKSIKAKLVKKSKCPKKKSPYEKKSIRKKSKSKSPHRKTPQRKRHKSPHLSRK